MGRFYLNLGNRRLRRWSCTVGYAIMTPLSLRNEAVQKVQGCHSDESFRTRRNLKAGDKRDSSSLPCLPAGLLGMTARNYFLASLEGVKRKRLSKKSKSAMARTVRFFIPDHFSRPLVGRAACSTYILDNLGLLLSFVRLIRAQAYERTLQYLKALPSSRLLDSFAKGLEG